MDPITPDLTALPPRAAWVELLTAVDRERLLAGAAGVERHARVRATALPQAGLHLLALRDGAFGEPFFLGEIPSACAQVVVMDAQGQEHAGGAWVMADDVALAQALAVLDAALAAGLPGADEARLLLAEGAARRAQIADARSRMLTATTVDFALLSEADPEEEDQDDHGG